MGRVVKNFDKIDLDKINTDHSDQKDQVRGIINNNHEF